MMELAMGSIAIIFVIYYYLMRRYNYWTNKGVPGPKPFAPFGTIYSIIHGKHSIATYMEATYNSYKDEPLVGIYKLQEPILLVNDLNLINDILIKDFSKFSDRGQDIHEKHERLSTHLFNLEPKRWRLLRTKLTPVFTSSKLKYMFDLVNQCGDRLEQYLEKNDDSVIDMREIASRYTIDVIGICVFGLEGNAIQDENSVFVSMGKRVFEQNVKNVTKFVSGFFLPVLYDKFIGYFTRDNVLDDFFLNITKETMRYRKERNIKRKDFVNLLMELKDNPLTGADDIELTDELLAAQMFVFFAAGYETSANTIANALYEMALNPSIQKKLREEIRNEFERTNAKYDYDGIKNMIYMHKVFQETLRKYPALPLIMRRSIQPYTFAGTNVTIGANVKIWVPILSIQRDAKHFPNPEVFDPERFSPENINTRDNMKFLAFGKGPRNCIGGGFATLQTKIGLMKILQNYEVSICKKTDKIYEFDRRAPLLTPKNGIFLRVKKLAL